MAKTFNDVGIKFLNNTKLNCELNIKLASITIMVSKPNLNKYTIDQFSPYVVLDDPENLKNLEIKMDYPKGVFSASIDPNVVDANCNKVKK